MDIILQFFGYISENWFHLITLTFVHILMVIIGLGLSLLIGVPLGILSAKNEKFAAPILALANIIQVFPALALLAILMVFLGLGFKTVIVALLLYSLLPIIRNTYIGLKEVDETISQAGIGVGMTPFQLLLKVQLPLSVPFLLAGVRVATIVAISLATIAPFIGGGGLGEDILSGINTHQPVKMYSGGILAALLAIFIDLILGKVQERVEYK
ncbi:ABC transporter permease [Lentibacillus halophilus]|uniref:ABC transporter permease n=1 Tax=Lentibacillus halophilus TaxID=295065 RepID=A0ABP3J2Y6_9BACI